MLLCDQPTKVFTTRLPSMVCIGQPTCGKGIAAAVASCRPADACFIHLNKKTHTCSWSVLDMACKLCLHLCSAMPMTHRLHAASHCLVPSGQLVHLRLALLLCRPQRVTLAQCLQHSIESVSVSVMEAQKACAVTDCPLCPGPLSACFICTHPLQLKLQVCNLLLLACDACSKLCSHCVCGWWP